MGTSMLLLAVSLLLGLGTIEGLHNSKSTLHSIQRRSARKASSIGGSKILECEIDYPEGMWAEHIITWRKQGIEVPIFIQFNGYQPHLDPSYQGRLRLVEQASVEVSDIRISDEGWYECTIVFLHGDQEQNSNGTWVYLSVNSPPSLGESSPSFLVRKEGDNVDLICEAMATPEPTLTWYKDGKELLPSNRVTVTGNQVQLRKLTRSDGGVYTCTFKNVVGKVSHVIKMVIEGEGWISSGNAFIMRAPKNTTAKEGSTIDLDCQAEGHPNNITYHWFKDGVDVKSMPTLMTRSQPYDDGRFVINSAEKGDSGWYKCQARNGMGPPPEAKAYVNITFIPRVLSMPMMLYLPNGMLGRIECPIEANPPITLVVWTKNDKAIDLQKNTRLKVNSQGTLIFKNVIASDEGRYRCTPYSAMGQGAVSKPVQIIVRDPPYFLVRPDPYYQRQPTQSVTMPCQAEGNPKPQISWRKADGTFPSTTKTYQENGNLTIANLGKEDHGTYECVATNIVTSVITTTLLLIELTTPHAPYNLTVAANKNEAKVSWLPAYDGGYPQHYVLWYKMNTGSREEWQTLRVIPDEATSITVYKLFPDTTYQFTVLSRNRLGDGLFSKIVTATTTALPRNDSTKHGIIMKPSTTDPAKQNPNTAKVDGPKPLPPRNLTVRQEGNSLRLSWLPPPNNSGDPVQWYKIEYRTVGMWVPLTDKLRGTTEFLWTTASRRAKYSFQVYAYTNHSHSDASKAITVETGDPLTEGVKISDGVIGGIVGGLLFLFIAIILAVVAVKIFNKRRQREKAMRYGNVKYFGPKQVEASKNCTNAEGSGEVDPNVPINPHLQVQVLPPLPPHRAPPHPVPSPICPDNQPSYPSSAATLTHDTYASSSGSMDHNGGGHPNPNYATVSRTGVVGNGGGDHDTYRPVTLDNYEAVSPIPAENHVPQNHRVGNHRGGGGGGGAGSHSQPGSHYGSSQYVDPSTIRSHRASAQALYMTENGANTMPIRQQHNANSTSTQF